MSHNDFLDEYEETVISQIGVKMLDFKDALDFPLYLRMFDVPGNAVSHLKDEESIFKNLDYAFVILDGSKVIHREHVLVLNTYVIQRLRAYNDKVISREQTDIKYKQYLFKLMGDTPEAEDSGSLIKDDGLYDRQAINRILEGDEDEKQLEHLEQQQKQK